jgi:hypothetical protein
VSCFIFKRTLTSNWFLLRFEVSARLQWMFSILVCILRKSARTIILRYATRIMWASVSPGIKETFVVNSFLTANFAVCYTYSSTAD